MSESERWARTQEQIDLLHEARKQGGLCAACGRRLDDGETVYFERFAVGTRQLRLHGPVRPRSFNFAPVGSECASSELLGRAEAPAPDRCVTCGRGVVYPSARPTRRWVSCSQRCALHASAAAPPRRPRQPSAVREKTERWGERLQRYREARGMSRQQLADALVALGRRAERNDINRYEEGYYEPRLRTFAALARVLGVSMDDLMWGEEEAARLAEERAPIDT